MSWLRRLATGFLLVTAISIILAALNYQAVLRLAGRFLVENSPPGKADAVIVLAGDHRGLRILHGAALVAQGYAPTVLVSGAAETYGVNDATLAIQYAVRKGNPASVFQPVYLQALSTSEEAHAFAPEIRKRHLKRILLVTSNYHTRRAAAIFRGVLGDGVTILSVAAPDPFFQPDSWWYRREGQKTVFFEYSKTVAGWLGL